MKYWRGQIHHNYKFGKPTSRDFRSAFGHSWQHEPTHHFYFISIVVIALIIIIAYLWS